MTPPAPIDFSTVFGKFDPNNAGVYSVIIALIVLYIVLGIWARHYDKKDVHKWQPRPLGDNLPSDQYFYQISVFTGWKAQAETKSRIHFIMVGAKGDSGVRALKPTNTTGHFTLKTGSINHFVLSTEQPLGQLSYLRIWHDNSGQGKFKSWFLDQIQVADLQNNRRYFFIVDRWLAVDHDDAQVERLVPVSSMSDLTSFKQLFSTSIRRKFSDEHLWASIASRPTRSVFTRVQRLSVGMTLLFTVMLTNAMFYQTPGGEDGEVNDSEAISLGPLGSISMQEIWVSFVSSLIIAPVNIAIVYIFQHLRPSKKSGHIEAEGIATKTSRSLKPINEKTVSDFADERMSRRNDTEFADGCAMWVTPSITN